MTQEAEFKAPWDSICCLSYKSTFLCCVVGSRRKSWSAYKEARIKIQKKDGEEGEKKLEHTCTCIVVETAFF